MTQEEKAKVQAALTHIALLQMHTQDKEDQRHTREAKAILNELLRS